MITKLFVPASNEYLEVKEDEAQQIKKDLTDKGYVCWIVFINTQN